MSIATPAFFWFPFAWSIFFHHPTFSLYVSLDLKWVSCRQHIYGSCFCIHSVSLCLLVGAFNPFTFKVIIDMYVPMTIFFIVLGFFFIIYLFIAVLGLRFCARAPASCGERGPLLIVVRGPVTIVASLVVEHGLQTHRLSSCGSRAQLLHGMWDPPRPGLEPLSPALASRLSTTVPPGKPIGLFL